MVQLCRAGAAGGGLGPLRWAGQRDPFLLLPEEPWHPVKDLGWVGSSTKSSWRPVASEVPKGLISGPILLKMFVNDLNAGAGGTLRVFAADTS